MLAGDSDPTRPEYVVSDMLRPLPELNWDFDTADEAAGDVHHAVLSVSDGQSGMSRAGREDGDAASHVVTAVKSDDSFSSGNESSPGGFRKRHSVSPFHQRVDKKSLQVRKGCSHSIRRSPPSDIALHGLGRGTRCVLPSDGLSSDTAFGQSVFNTRGHVRHRGHADRSAVVSSAVCCGRGRGVNRSHCTEVGQPVFNTAASATCWPPDSCVFLGPLSDTSDPQLGLRSYVHAAAPEDDLPIDTGRQRDTRQVTSELYHSSHDQLDRRTRLFAAVARDSSPPGEHQYLPVSRYLPPPLVPRYVPPPELPVNGRVADKKSKSDTGESTVTSSAADAGAAGVGRDSSARRRSKVVRRGCVLMLLEDSDDNDLDGHTDGPVGTETELIQFKSPVRCVHSATFCQFFTHRNYCCSVSSRFHAVLILL